MATSPKRTLGWATTRSICSIAIAILCATTPVAQAENGCRDGRKIVGGSTARPEHWPGFAALRLIHPDTNVSLQFCGATAITKDWLVTAAHCFDDIVGTWKNVVSRTDDTSRLRIEAVVGVASLDDATAENIYPVERVIQHETYATTYKRARANDPQRAPLTAHLAGHDIAVVKLARSWLGPFSRLSLTDSNNSRGPVDPDEHVIVAGFGATTPQGADLRIHTRANGQKYYASSPDLLEVTLPFADKAACRAALRHQLVPEPVIGDGQICAGFNRPAGKDSCNGDSGGPLVLLDKNLCPTQVGLVSWGPSPCAPEKSAYGVYTRLSAHARWLRDNVPGLR